MNDIIELTRYGVDEIEEAIPHIYAMAIELRKANELTGITFAVTYNLLSNQQGCFYTASKDGSIVGYACFSFGEYNPDIRRLYYFAVPNKVQGSGIGSKVIMTIINNELPSSNGALTVACKASLSSFYEKIGFINTGVSEDCAQDVVLTYSKNSLIDPNYIIDQVVFYLSVDLNTLAPHLSVLEREFKLDLTSDLPKSLS